jgi:hypothetical protein
MKRIYAEGRAEALLRELYSKHSLLRGPIDLLQSRKRKKRTVCINGALQQLHRKARPVVLFQGFIQTFEIPEGI